jgi:DNA-binding PadR family transcriptional regulator
MHPYEMQRVIRERGKDEFLDLKRGSLYHAVERLERACLIEPLETSREGKRPERTVYRITEAGVDQLLEWMCELIARPGGEINDFVAAIAHLPHLRPGEAADLLEVRAAFLKAEIAAIDTMIDTLAPRIGRVVLLESDLVRALKGAEMDWITGLVADLRAAVYDWNIEEIQQNPGHTPGMPGGEVEE